MGCTMTAWLNTRVVCSSSGTTWNHRHVKAPSPFGVKYLRAGGAPYHQTVGRAPGNPQLRASCRFHIQTAHSMSRHVTGRLAAGCWVLGYGSETQSHRDGVSRPHTVHGGAQRASRKRASDMLAALGSRLCAVRSVKAQRAGPAAHSM